jgi:exodeoxyribonuclease VII small subunit
MPAKKNAEENFNYHELSIRLDEVVAKLEDPDTEIDELVELYAQALQIIKQLEDYLDKAENRILEVKAKYSKEG